MLCPGGYAIHNALMTNLVRSGILGGNGHVGDISGAVADFLPSPALTFIDSIGRCPARPYLYNLPIN